MDQEDKILLFFKKLRGRLLPGEEDDLRSWTGADPERQAVGREVERIWEASGRYKAGYRPDVDAGFRRLQQRMDATQRTSPGSFRPWRPWLAAAATVALLAVALWWWKDALFGPYSPDLVVVSSEGNQRNVLLPDGSRVLLNRSSTLTYPALMDGQPARNLTLSGEAYFDVVPDERHPFRIRTEEAEVVVLGTAFNLRAYPGEPTTEVEVESGRVHFAARKGRQQLTLEANDRGILDQSGGMQIADVPQLPAHAWRTGTLRLRSIPLREGLQAMERFFGVSLDLENGEMLADCQLTLGNFQRQELAEALVVLETNFNFSIKAIDTTHYRLIGGACPH